VEGIIYDTQCASWLTFGPVQKTGPKPENSGLFLLFSKAHARPGVSGFAENKAQARPGVSGFAENKAQARPGFSGFAGDKAQARPGSAGLLLGTPGLGPSRPCRSPWPVRALLPCALLCLASTRNWVW
jgi:hypothetical protein